MKKKSILKKELAALLIAALMAIPSVTAGGAKVQANEIANPSPAVEIAEAEPDVLIYLDDSGKYTFEERAADLVSRMTLAEKASQMSNSMPAIPRLGIPSYAVWCEALHGLRTSNATSYPISLSMGSTWNPALINNMADAISSEGRAINNPTTPGGTRGYGLTYWSPVVEPLRDPRWGRNSEGYSEDSFLTAKIGSAFTDGLMGDDDKYVKAFSTAKHFVANNIENVRMSGTSHVTETDLYEYYIRPYRSMLLNSKLSSIMTAYNRVNNVPVSTSVTLVDKLVRKMWGMEGYVTGDCKAVNNISQNFNYVGDKFADLDPSPAIGAALALTAGVDSDCTWNGQNAYVQAVTLGYIPESELDEAVITMFTVRMKLGFFDGEAHPWTIDKGYTQAEHRQVQYQKDLAVKIAEEAIVLLENENDFLPLDASKYEGKKIALIGPYANLCDLGGYSGTPAAANRITPDAAIRAYFQNKGINCDISLVTGGTASIPAVIFNFRSATLVYKDGSTATLGWQDINLSESKGIRIYDDWSGTWMLVTENDAEVVFNDINIQDVDYLTFAASSSISNVPVTIDVAVSDAFVPIERYESVSGITATTRFPFNAAGQENGKVKFTFSIPVDEFNPTQLDGVKDADLFLVFVGAGTAVAAEERDRPYLYLPGTQQQLVEYVVQNFDNTAVIMETMGMMEVETFKDDCDAMIWYSYNGQAQGTAISNMLFGEVNPSAKLPFTWYQDLGNVPDQFDYTLTGKSQDGESTGRTYMYYDGKITYPFGYGLSYTTFEYSNMKIDKNTFTPNDGVTVTVDVKNTGKIDGYEIVQVYVAAPDHNNPDRPNKNLFGFDKVWIPAGETKTVSIVVDAAELWYYDDPDGDSLNQEETPRGQKNTSPDLVVNGNIAYMNGEYIFEVASAASNLTNDGKAGNSLTKTVTMQGELDIALQAVTLQSGTIETGKPQIITDGDSIQSALTVSLNNDTFLDNNEAEVTYSSNRESVAIVDENGMVTAVGEGVVTITATVAYKGKTMSNDFALKVMIDPYKPVFTDDDGNTVDSLSSETLNVSKAYENTSGKAVSLIMYVAVYSPDGKLQHLEKDIRNVETSQIGNFQVSLDMPQNADGSYALEGYTATVFLWDSDTFVPVIEKYIF